MRTRYGADGGAVVLPGHGKRHVKGRQAWYPLGERTPGFVPLDALNFVYFCTRSLRRRELALVSFISL